MWRVGIWHVVIVQTAEVVITLIQSHRHGEGSTWVGCTAGDQRCGECFDVLTGDCRSCEWD